MLVDQVVYLTALTLIVFLIFRIPTVWQRVDFTRGSARSNGPAGGAAAILIGFLILGIHWLMGPTHTRGSVNYAAEFNVSLIIFGLACLIFGLALILKQLTLKEPTFSAGSCETETLQ